MAMPKESKGKIDISQLQKVQYCIPLWLRDLQIEAAIKRVPGRIKPFCEETQEPIAVVCFGPSLNDTWKQIKDFKYIITCSGAHKFLVDKGVIPTWHCDVDPREHKIQLIGQPQKETEYLMASTCHPKMWDHLEGYNVKLWHIFDGQEDALRTLPAGEWALFGGSSAGLRALTVARFLGFRNLHVFGMDGNQGKSGKHADKHPNQPKDYQTCEYGGKVWETTASMAECARQTPHEIDQLNDVTATFYGEGLTQAIMKDYKRKAVPKNTPIVGFNKPELITPEFKELNAKLHKDNPAYGVGGGKHAETVIKLADSIKAQSILDYGCGKGMLAKALARPIWEYDPAIPGKDTSPRPADLVVCTDVLEHIEPDKIGLVVEDLRRCVKQVGYFIINTKKAEKTYADGRNTHLLVKDKTWWTKTLSKFFLVGKVEELSGKLHVIVGPKPKEAAQPETDITKVGEAKFYTPNTTTKWRANTLLTKEPITVEWINSMKSGEVLFDVGANVGGYTVLAGARGVQVCAFEPEAENYALLVRNIRLNKIDDNVRAYCLALASNASSGLLFLSQAGVGGSCHNFAATSSINSQLKQGCISMSLDSLLNTEGGALPQPDHIKIDVDGNEYSVILGAINALSKVKSILVEVNTNSESHLQLVAKLQELGFEYNQAQVDKAIRKEGPFKGCAEYLFKKTETSFKNIKRVYYESTSVLDGGYSVSPDDTIKYLERFIANKIKDCDVIESPTPHIFIEDVFPTEFYESILANLTNKYTEISKVRGVKGYKERLVSLSSQTPFWKGLDSKLRNGVLREKLCSKFGIVDEQFTDETLLIRDLKGYSIGPHTDSTAKVISALFYLPADESQIDAGTSLYTPKDKDFKCVGGPHHDFARFDKVVTLPFKPNSLFAFLKTDTSFHGVEPYTGEKPRDVLLYDIRKV